MEPLPLPEAISPFLADLTGVWSGFATHGPYRTASISQFAMMHDWAQSERRATLAQYFGIDVTIMRLALVLLFLVSHSVGLPIYVILRIVMPQEPAPAPRYDPYTGQPLS